MYDIVFISYEEPNADENFNNLYERFNTSGVFGNRVKRVANVKGIHQAHINAAKACFTKMFWVVDADAAIVDDFNFDYTVEEWDLDTVHVWNSKNPINDLVYGYGGVKLLPRKATMDMDTTTSDMTTSISNKFKVMPEVSNITKFNTDPFSTWRSAFRECAKLSSKAIDRQDNKETEERLQVWTTIGKERPFGEYAIRGAIEGQEFGILFKDKLHLINDFDWLKSKFKEG